MTTPRPDQQHGPSVAGASGSRSGSGDLAAALSYPGSPPAVPNCLSAQALRRSIVGAGSFFTFPHPGRVWTVLLSYMVVSDNTFTPVAKFAATIQTTIGALPLAVVELGLGNVNHEAFDVCPVSYNGLPVVKGDGFTLTINGGTAVPGVQQEASAVVLYSIP
jgi:hypothetical protein